MALKTFVKISEVSNLSDARYCAGMGVDQLGFNVTPGHPNFVDIEKFNEIIGWVAGVEFVGEFDDQPLDYIKEALSNYKFDYIQTSRVDLLSEVNQLSQKVILNLNVDEYEDVNRLEQALKYASHSTEYFLIHSQGNDENSYNWHTLAPMASSYRLVLGSWVDSRDIGEMLANTNFRGIALKGGNEIKPGYKDFDGLADILELIETEDQY
ncbi:N-(5'-phosphoribosyl)anthranilate isomerase [Fulvivirgaceae bacterium BMA12]|uniref:N-(5'-phosphoribosyl)anthranilate isomerase n=1 Tax=Agaribacillus aureus TaxID=3051825 RepID=A0ABT8L049_9BACT|nr:N-(5'-phosphoribosyl)anthranilate isomerase [Fulvivirgaceae bacterium BMA12]